MLKEIDFFFPVVFFLGNDAAAYSCSMEICLNSNSENKLRYLDYFMHRINLLRHHKITPVVVFDGGNIPCKAGTEQDRYRLVKFIKKYCLFG